MADQSPAGPPPLPETVLSPEKIAQVQIDFTWYGDPSHDDAIAVCKSHELLRTQIVGLEGRLDVAERLLKAAMAGGRKLQDERDRLQRLLDRIRFRVEAADVNNDDLGKLRADVDRMIKEGT